MSHHSLMPYHPQEEDLNKGLQEVMAELEVSLEDYNKASTHYLTASQEANSGKEQTRLRKLHEKYAKLALLERETRET